MLGDSLALGDDDGETDALGLTLRDCEILFEIDGLMLFDGLLLGLIDAEGL
jgi:hypothetical protein